MVVQFAPVSVADKNRVQFSNSVSSPDIIPDLDFVFGVGVRPRAHSPESWIEGSASLWQTSPENG